MVTTPGTPNTAASSLASLAVVSRLTESGSNRQISSNALCWPGGALCSPGDTPDPPMAPTPPLDRPASTDLTKAGILTPPPPRIDSFISATLHQLAPAQLQSGSTSTAQEPSGATA